MSETIEDTCLVKFLCDPEVVTPVASDATQGAWGSYEIVNLGTAATTGEHSISVFISYSGAQWRDSTRKLDDPVLEANGGSYKGAAHFRMDELPWAGDWVMSFQVNRGVNEGITDVVHVPFRVEHLTNG
jgi:hypothetical protein